MATNDTLSPEQLSPEQLTLEQQIAQYKQINIQIYSMYNRINEFRNRKKILEKIIYTSCKHEWERDLFDTGLYSSMTYICSKCDLYR